MSEQLNDRQHARSHMQYLKVELEYFKHQRDVAEQGILRSIASIRVLAETAVAYDWADWANDSLSNFDVVWKGDQ